MNTSALKKKKKSVRDFPGGPVVKNLSSNAGFAGSIPGWGTKIPHAAGQLGPLITTTEPAHIKERAGMPQATEPACSGACTPQLKRSLHAATGEKPERRSEDLT